MTTTVFDPKELRRIFSGCPSGVVAICAEIDGTPTGMAVSTFVPVSLEPALVGVFIQNTSRTWPMLERGTRLGLSVLGSDNEHAATALAMKEGNRFESITTTVADSGAVYVDGATTWLEGAVWSKTPAGDHFMVLLEVHSATIHDVTGPLIFHASTFHRLPA
ncbi:flavin reductase family protein [Rhodococcus sp. DMU1]|uniref:flavin reductase family protein n=1 Tax=Rhodococcus sp. DMU1 TaxID=2722825 RepID=UPI00143E262D|nr:flavin reductase family protein [Rhodococcus sp. DMU1]QIX53639.1 flavin reductase family protein [Rhodococcus sp. DMU1]